MPAPDHGKYRNSVLLVRDKIIEAWLLVFGVYLLQTCLDVAPSLPVFIVELYCGDALRTIFSCKIWRCG